MKLDAFETPDSPVCRAALEVVRTYATPAPLHHSWSVAAAATARASAASFKATERA